MITPKTFQYGTALSCLTWIITWIYCVFSAHTHPYIIYPFDRVIIVLCVASLTLTCICLISWAVLLTFGRWDKIRD